MHDEVRAWPGESERAAARSTGLERDEKTNKRPEDVEKGKNSSEGEASSGRM